MNKKVEKAMNYQINRELYSSYLYLAMSAYLESINLKGYANWMRCQAQEELLHAIKLYNHVVERGGRAVMEAIEAPEKEWKSPLAVAEATYLHEQNVTKLIHNLASLVDDEKDYPSKGLMQWFVDEQIEEESSSDELVQQLKLLKDNGPGLLLLDKELSTRVFNYPTTLDLKGGK
jgi:ferritin